jgi:hypothetical protein
MQTSARTSWLPEISTRMLLLVAVTGCLWGAVVKVALAQHYHVTCVAHGFVHGESTTDGSFFARVESGCGAGVRECKLYVYGSLIGSQTASGSTTCNFWSRSAGSFSECGSTAHTYASGVFSSHVHKAHNYCA